MNGAWIGKTAMACMSFGGILAAGTAPVAQREIPHNADAPACMEHCRLAIASVQKAADLLDQVRACGEGGCRENLLIEAQTQLSRTRQEVGRCLLALDRPERSAVAGHRSLAVWHCPMHLSVRQNKPGNCPVCDMHLRVVSAEPSGSQPAPGLQAALKPRPSRVLP